jgi:hypothetical protein
MRDLHKLQAAVITLHELARGIDDPGVQARIRRIADKLSDLVKELKATVAYVSSNEPNDSLRKA